MLLLHGIKCESVRGPETLDKKMDLVSEQDLTCTETEQVTPTETHAA